MKNEVKWENVRKQNEIVAVKSAKESSVGY